MLVQRCVNLSMVTHLAADDCSLPDTSTVVGGASEVSGDDSGAQQENHSGGRGSREWSSAKPVAAS